MKKILIGFGFLILAWLLLHPYYLFPDGQGHFSYLSSLFYDGDLQFYNDFVNMRIPVPIAMTDTGYISNNWPFGAALFWSPFYLVAKVFADPSFSPYNKWFWYWINIGTMFYGALAALLLFGLRKTDGRKNGRITLIVAAAIMGTPAFFFLFLLPSNAIGITAFVSTVFIWYWLISMKEPDRLERYILLGLILGAGAMVRQQDALLGLAPMAELIVRIRKREIKPSKALGNFAALGVSFVAAFSPQFLIWKTVNGSFLAAPSKFNLSWKYFALDKTLFSPYHGLLFWTPVFFTAFAGLVLAAFRKPAAYLGLIMVFLAQLLTNSCCIAFWEGYSFGLRQMTSLLPIVFLGLIEFYESFRNRNAMLRIVGNILIFAPVLWTVGLTWSFYLGLLDLLNPMSVKALLLAQKNGLVYLSYLPGKVLAIPRPDLGSFGVMTIASLVFFYLSVLVKRGIEKQKLKVVIGISLAVVVAFNLIILRAAANKPAYAIPRDQVTTQQGLDNYFIRDAENLKKKYNIK
jgi:hypothetical protein